MDDLTDTFNQDWDEIEKTQQVLDQLEKRFEDTSQTSYHYSRVKDIKSSMKNIFAQCSILTNETNLLPETNHFDVSA